jgi:ABC-type multidrug transport system ATPase subunit
MADLTVWEHLTFFGMLKGLSGAPLKGRLKHIIADVGLVEKKDVLSKSLSGAWSMP